MATSKTLWLPMTDWPLGLVTGLGRMLPLPRACTTHHQSHSPDVTNELSSMQCDMRGMLVVLPYTKVSCIAIFSHFAINYI